MSPQLDRSRRHSLIQKHNALRRPRPLNTIATSTAIVPVLSIDVVLRFRRATRDVALFAAANHKASAKNASESWMIPVVYPF